MKGAEKASMKRSQTPQQSPQQSPQQPPQSPQSPQSDKDKLNLKDITEQQLNELLQQGITLDQIAQIAQEQGEPIPPLVASMMEQQGIGISNSAPAPQPEQGQPEQGQPEQGQPGQGQPEQGQPEQGLPSKSKKYPTMMNSTEYKAYQDVVKKEEEAKAKQTQSQKTNVYGYVFSPLLSEELMKDMKRTQGSFFVGVNIANLMNTFRDMIVDSEKKAYKPKSKLLKSNPDSIFNKIGEWVDVDFNTILDKKMGERGSDVPLLPEKRLTEYSTFYEILSESKKYSDRGFNGKITPYSLLIMTRMLFKYRNNNAQWIRVSTVLELIYKYLGDYVSREKYFKNNDEISVRSLMELEEFYNTDHIFMSKSEIKKFKETLNFYKYDKNTDVKKQIAKIQTKIAPPI